MTETTPDYTLPGGDWRDVEPGTALTDEQALRRFLQGSWSQQLRYMADLRDVAAEHHDAVMRGHTRERFDGFELLLRDQHRELQAMREADRVPRPLVTQATAQAFEEGKREGARAERRARGELDRQATRDALHRIDGELTVRQEQRPVTRRQQPCDALTDAELDALRAAGARLEDPDEHEYRVAFLDGEGEKRGVVIRDTTPEGATARALGYLRAGGYAGQLRVLSVTAGTLA